MLITCEKQDLDHNLRTLSASLATFDVNLVSTPQKYLSSNKVRPKNGRSDLVNSYFDNFMKSYRPRRKICNSFREIYDN